MQSIEERYETAGNTSNLKVVARSSGAGDVLIASGWSRVRTGGALMRLHSEWEGSAKKQRMSDTDMLLLRMRLKSLGAVLAQVVAYMEYMGLERPLAKAGPVVGYWLHKVCATCHGQAFELIRDTPVLGNLRCKSCHGSGVGAIPYGREGQHVMDWMDECVQAHRSSMKTRLHYR